MLDQRGMQCRKSWRVDPQCIIGRQRSRRKDSAWQELGK
jgi:hypothetical protein